MKDMEDLTAEIPSNEKSCQTDEVEEKAPALRPGHLNQSAGKSSLSSVALQCQCTARLELVL